MRYVGSALLAVLLTASVAHATVYVWRDHDGALVLTNIAGQLRDAPNGPLITYPSTGSSSPPAAADGGGDAVSPAPAAASRPAVAPPASDTDAASAAPTAGAPENGAPRTLGDANARHLIAAATTPTERAAVEPRALLDVAARAEPPRVIVSIVGASAGPLSTSDGATSLANRGSRGLSGRTPFGADASPPGGARSSGGNGGTTAMR